MKRIILLAVAALALLSCEERRAADNPLFDGEWYADPEVAFLDGKYWIFPTWSKPFKEQLFLDCFSSEDLVTWVVHR